MISFASPRAQYLSHRKEINARILAVLEKGRYILGEEVAAFETEFAAYVGVAFGVGVGSGTDALSLALRTFGIGPNDEVITVSHTAVATVAAIEVTGARPVLVDIQSDGFAMDPKKLDALISPHVKAIIPVHLYGAPADMSSICAVARRHGLRVIEDCAQAHGATYQGRRVGSWGDVGCFSFYPTKNLGAFGDGGMIVTQDAVIAERARLLREYGWVERYKSEIAGMNSRLDEMQATTLRVKLRFLEADNKARRHQASLYREGLEGTDFVLPRDDADASGVYHLYVIRSNKRNELRSFLQRCGVETLVHYPLPVHLQPAYKNRLRGADQLPFTERAAHDVLSLPLYPELAISDTEYVIKTLKSFR